MKTPKMAIERRIRPLVDALNNTGLVTTFSSCEGHFDEIDSERWSERAKAEVRFELNEGVSETDLEKLFGLVIGNHVNSPLMWKATLIVLKEYVPGEGNDFRPDHVFAFEIRPFDPHEPAKEKRKHVDLVIKQTLESVREHIRSGQRRRRSRPESTSRNSAPALSPRRER